MEMIPLNRLELVKAFDEYFELAFENLKILNNNLDNIIKLHEQGDTRLAYENLLKYIEYTRTAFIDGRLKPGTKIPSLVREDEPRALFIDCAIIQVKIIKNKCEFLQLVLQTALRDKLQLAYKFLLLYCQRHLHRD